MQAENKIQQEEASMRDLLVQKGMGQASIDREKALLDRGASTQVRYDQMVAQFNSRVAQGESQRLQIENEKLAFQQRQRDLAKATIRSPTDAIVAEVVSHQGDTLNVFRTAPVIVRLANVQNMIVRARVSEVDIHKIKPGQKVYFTILGQPGKRRYSTVKSTEVSAAGISLDPELTTGPKEAIYYNVTFDTPNEDGLLMPSMTVEVHVVLGESADVLTVPARAVSRGPGGSASVQVVQPSGVIVARPVTVGISNSFQAEIRSGLQAGERVLMPEPVPLGPSPVAAKVKAT
jgi:macrolide-specific efflux system membrane fusion protein